MSDTAISWFALLALVVVLVFAAIGAVVGIAVFFYNRRQ